jgi:hypothetical protein
VFSFDRPVASSGSVSIQGAGSVAPPAQGQANPSVGSNSNQVVVNLQGVTNQQHLVVTLSNVRDTSGNTFGPISARMDVLIGDVTGDGFVLSGDYSLVRQKSGAAVDAGTFRYDINGDGFILSGDYTIARQNSGSHLP